MYQVGDFLLLCHAARADNRYEHWISPLAADKAADKPADAEEGHGPNSPCLSVWKNRVSRRGRPPRARGPARAEPGSRRHTLARTALDKELGWAHDGSEVMWRAGWRRKPRALLKGLIVFGLA